MLGYIFIYTTLLVLQNLFLLLMLAILSTKKIDLELTVELNSASDQSQVVFPRGSCWGLFCSVSLLMTYEGIQWTSVILQITPSWEEVLMCLGVG